MDRQPIHLYHVRYNPALKEYFVKCYNCGKVITGGTIEETLERAVEEGFQESMVTFFITCPECREIQNLD